MAEKKIRMSAEGLENLRKRLVYLQNEGRDEVGQKIKEARSQGDLSENAEYDAALDEQAKLEAEIADLLKKIDLAEIVSADDISTDEVGIGSWVRLMDYDMEEELKVQIVGSTEADPENNKISEDAPLGIAALKKKVGDVIEVEAPNDIIIKMEILEISKESFE